jgi:hypothetical protein
MVAVLSKRALEQRCALNSAATLVSKVAHPAMQRVSNVELGLGEVQSILRTLLYDGLIKLRDSGGEEVYRLAKDCAPDTTAFTGIPCGICPVSSHCPAHRRLFSGSVIARSSFT